MRIFFAFHFFLATFLVSCASEPAKQVEAFFDTYNANIEKHIKSRLAQIKFVLKLLNDEITLKKYDKQRVEELKKRISVLHKEQDLLKKLDPSILKLDCEIIEEKEFSPTVSEITIKVSGKTILSKPGEPSKIVDIPEQARYMRFSAIKEKHGYKIIGPEFIKLKEADKNKFQLFGQGTAQSQNRKGFTQTNRKLGDIAQSSANAASQK